MPFTLESPAFRNGGAIPVKYARCGGNLSPPLHWKDAPPGTKSFALIVDDPDTAGPFHHWAVYDIDRRRSQLPEGSCACARIETLGHGVNDFGNLHYDGPLPLRGRGLHHYHFRLAALDVDALHMPARPGVEAVWRAVQPHLIAQTELIGTF